MSGRLFDSRHHLGPVVGNPACLVIDRALPGNLSAASCPEDGVYWITARDRTCRWSFGACVEHAAQARQANVDERLFDIESITTDHPLRDAS